MVEDIGKIISNGIGTYTKNLNLSIPFILNLFVTGLMFVIMVAFGFFLILGSSLGSLSKNTRPEDFFATIIPFITQHILEIGFMVLIIILITLFVGTFFMAGAIGMAKQATETGKTSISALMEAGKDNVVNLFLAEILLGLLSLAGLVFLVPGAMQVDFSRIFSPENFSPQNTGALFLLLGGFIVWMVYLLILSIILSPVRFALVVDKLGPIESIAAGYGFFKKNWVDVILLFLIVIAIVMVLWFIDMFMGFIPIINIIWPFVSLFINLFVLQPLVTVWWVRLYMTRTGKNIYINDLLAHPNDLGKP
ncbi:MAG: hypothetical protein FIB08_00485 [Candidatus Methanoperedens sp.]|nr:hypothetical protein [Candidatus Methanoperedens sp.]